MWSGSELCWNTEVEGPERWIMTKIYFVDCLATVRKRAATAFPLITTFFSCYRRSLGEEKGYKAAVSNSDHVA